MYKFLEHTADFKIQVISDSLENLFKESLIALNDFLKPTFGKKSKDDKMFLKAENLELLYIDFLSQLLSKTYVEKMIFNVDEIKLNLQENSLEAQLKGIEYKRLKKDIKAVTYHQTKIEKKDGRYIGEFVIDV